MDKMFMKNKKTIYLINLEFPPLSGPGIWRILSFAKYLSDEYKIIVLCSNHSIFFDNYDYKKLEEVPDNVSVYRIKSLFQKDYKKFISKLKSKIKNDFITKLIDGLSWRIEKIFVGPATPWAVSCAIVGLMCSLKNKPDYVITSGPPHDSHLAGYLLKKILRTKWIMDYRDPWNKEWFYPEINKPCTFQQKIEKRFFKVCSAFMTVSPVWATFYGENFEIKNKTKILRNGYDIDINHLKEDFRSGVSDRLHIHFNGTLQNVNFPKALPVVISKLKKIYNKQNTPIFTFTGFDEIVHDSIVKNDIFDLITDCGRMSHYNSLKYCLGCDVLLSMIDEGPIYNRGFVPAKTYEAMALGKHILGILPEESDVIKILNEYGNSTICYADDHQGIYNTIVDMIEKKISNKYYFFDLPLNNEYVSQFNRKKICHSLSAMLKEL